ncbi:hypothetical protein NQ318_009352 [Aromia moschata]|uniref:Purine nucleoside phosphorylase n=1 Tax=Aromia moschata TaxID=1265417 RepID=A0AAV8X659_9CUCU|nr:hypothetical protein NQ318_009352 [Aromia moschata]
MLAAYLGSMGEAVRDAVKIDYTDIPYFPTSTVPGHRGRLIFGYVSDVPVICMQGRFHYYEGYPLSKCVMPVRLMKLLGVTHLIASNAAGGLNENYKVGDVMLQKDHLNLMGFAGNNPLRGPNEARFGPRFFAMTNAYDRSILKGIKGIVSELGMQDRVQEGVYTCMGGPNYETVAELRALKMMGIDAVGMSTVHEVTAARHCGMKCFAFSLITNICSVDYDCDIEANGDEVLDVGKSKEEDLKVFVEHVVGFIGKNWSVFNKEAWMTLDIMSALIKSFDSKIKREKKDHLNFMGFAGNNPLRGLNEAKFGPRFFAMTNPYDRSILKGVKGKSVRELFPVAKVTAASTGRMFAFSLITNICTVDYDCDVEANGDEVLDVGKSKGRGSESFCRTCCRFYWKELLYRGKLCQQMNWHKY